MSKIKQARFEITKAGSIGKEYSDNPNNCLLVLEIPNKYISIIIEELQKSLEFDKLNIDSNPNNLLCLLVSGKPHPQTYGYKYGDPKRPPSFLSEEFNNTEK